MSSQQTANPTTPVEAGPRPTRTTREAKGHDGQFGTTYEWASLNSVELTQSAKGEVRLSTVKVYDVDEQTALDRAIAVFEAAKTKIARLNPQEPAP